MEIFKTYPSGLRLVAKHIPTAYTVSVGVYVNVGSVREEENENGFSHFIEHLLFKGTKNRTSLEISECMEDIGAQLNAFTSKDNTCYYTKSASGDLEKCLDLLSDLVLNPVFDEDELNRERNVVLEEISMNDDRPDDVLQDLLAQAIYKDSKLGQTILGLEQNIQYCDRHSIIDFKNKYYVPSNMVVSVAGNFDFDKLDQQIEKYFEHNFSASGTIPDEEKPKFTSEFIHQFKDVEQSHLAVAFPGVAMDSSVQASSFYVMNSILGGSMSSRLFQKIREENGLAYSVYSYPSSYSNTGYLEIYCGTNPENTTKVVDLLNSLLKDFVKNGITEKELNRAKTQAINGLYMSMEDSLNVMMANGRRVLKLNKVLDIDERTSNYEKVTKADVDRKIAETFAQPFASCYVGSEIDAYSEISKIKLS